MSAGEIRKSRPPIGILGGMALLAIVGAAIWLGWNRFPASPAPANTTFATQTFTPTKPVTPTLTSTQTPRPTATATHPPAWVTNFADPILAAIANRPPDFQDDFEIGSAGWKEDHPGNMEYVNGELVFTNCRIYRSNIDWRDFVVEFIIRYMAGTTPYSYFEFHFRDLGSSGHSFRIDQNGDVLIGFKNTGGMELSGAHSANQTNHVLLIAKENEFAFYLNGKPFYHTQNDAFRFGKLVFYAEHPRPNDQAILAMDNFKIWDISDLP